ncbi:hypothetical protein NL676_035207 [Syzygium grande]|nr:hypothetical protein NL676_035207 [Syzygium grande]
MKLWWVGAKTETKRNVTRDKLQETASHSPTIYHSALPPLRSAVHAAARPRPYLVRPINYPPTSSPHTPKMVFIHKLRSSPTPPVLPPPQRRQQCHRLLGPRRGRPPQRGSITLRVAPIDSLGDPRKVVEPRRSDRQPPEEARPSRSRLRVRVRLDKLRAQLRGRPEPGVGWGVPGRELLGEAAEVSGSVAAGKDAGEEVVAACR